MKYLILITSLLFFSSCSKRLSFTITITYFNGDKEIIVHPGNDVIYPYLYEGCVRWAGGDLRCGVRSFTYYTTEIK